MKVSLPSKRLLERIRFTGHTVERIWNGIKGRKSRRNMRVPLEKEGEREREKFGDEKGGRRWRGRRRGERTPKVIGAHLENGSPLTLWLKTSVGVVPGGLWRTKYKEEEGEK